MTDELFDRCKMILEEIKANPTVSQAQLMKKLPLSDWKLRNTIAFLKESGRISFVQTRQGSRWIIHE